MGGRLSKILDRYASAVRSSNLRSNEATTYSDTDVLGAAGLAAKRNPLAIALARLFCGDNGAAPEIVTIMADMAWGKAQAINVKLRRVESIDIARAVLAWHRDGKCRVCGGHGFALIDGSRTIGDAECGKCYGTGRVPFDRNFKGQSLVVASWLIAEVEREQAKAGPAAMQKLAPRLVIDA